MKTVLFRKMQKTIYFDQLNKPISIQQIDLLDNYSMLVYEDDVAVLKKSFYNKGLTYLVFYNPQNLSNSDAINLISQEYPVTPFDIVSETPMGNYKMRTYLAHDANANYDGKHIELVDQNNYIICLEEYDENDALENVTKYALNSNGGEIIFRYSRFDRSLQSVSGVAGNSFNENVSISDFEINYPNFLNTHPYYQDGTFLP